MLRAGAAAGSRPIVLPKFVANREIPASYGYQEVHKLYDDMRQFFARKALSTHQQDIVSIKVTMMTWKPGYKSAHIVSVRTCSLVEHHCIE